MKIENQYKNEISKSNISIITLEQIKKELQVMVQFQDFFNKEKTKKISNPTVINTGLFKNIDLKKDFGIARAYTDIMTKLYLILKNSILDTTNLPFKVISELKTTNGLIIKLKYILESLNIENAQEEFYKYKTKIYTTGFQTWIAYWLMANLQGATEFMCPMTDIMNLLKSENRKFKYFSVKEKKEFYEDTKRCSKTEFKICKISGKTEKWIETPILSILGGEKIKGDSYPKNIAIRVLSPNIFEIFEKFTPTILKIGTLKLHPKDYALAIIFQNRASQRGWGNKNIKFDWSFLFSACNYDCTLKSNSRMAKVIMRKKLKRIKNCPWVEELRK